MSDGEYVLDPLELRQLQDALEDEAGADLGLCYRRLVESRRGTSRDDVDNVLDWIDDYRPTPFLETKLVLQPGVTIRYRPRPALEQAIDRVAVLDAGGLEAKAMSAAPVPPTRRHPRVGNPSDTVSTTVRV